MLAYYHAIAALVGLALLAPLARSLPPPSSLRRAASQGTLSLQPPVAKKVPSQHKYHGTAVDDVYHWMTDKRQKQDVKMLLTAETAYAEQLLPMSNGVRKQLYDELIMTSKERKDDVAYTSRHQYYSQVVPGKQYPVYYRKTVDSSSPPTMIFDVAELGAEAGEVGNMAVNKDETMLAFAIDANGSEEYTLYFKDLSSKQLLRYKITGTTGEFVWSDTGKSIIYVRSRGGGRASHVLQHVVGNPTQKDTVLREVRADVARVSLVKSASGRFIFIREMDKNRRFSYPYLNGRSDSLVSAIQFSFPTPGEMVAIHHLNKQFLFEIRVRSEQTMTMQYYVCDEALLLNRKAYVRVLHDVDPATSELVIFHKHLAAFQRNGLTTQVSVYAFDDNGMLRPGAQSRPIELPSKSFSITPVGQPFESNTLRFIYSSLITPETIYSYDMNTGNTEKAYLNEVPGYVEANYVTDVIHADTKDVDENGKLVRIPITIAHRRDMQRTGLNRAWLTGYGAYSVSYIAQFQPNVMALLKKGFVYAIAHVRGGGELGRSWHVAGARLRKKNSFSDFALVADTLVTAKYTSHDSLVIEGGSAGGMLVGAVINERPNIAKVAILKAPFLNVVDTMMDPDNPNAYEDSTEWGTPQTSLPYYTYIRSYSPYENIRPRVKYPNILVTAGFNDPRVAYWDPAKWVAKLRASRVEDPAGDGRPHTIAMITDMNAGHYANSNILESMKQMSYKLAYAIDRLKRP
ncbi:prolyl oligopeptidase family-domain-containing protein [Syncephalis pseudoplumigaleata]|uniref:Prolyl endopeptidase n=1 Tax=Syncephalis pseudoplumigaleata TaxID=1712513 RepID=A0A4P9Z3G9_9FUNG|nr:prolyl oligopeptidase family-domain-containing protein [Syncephalis pseudoplumigaleata]|eukprot:RKP27074.1 prolyl oligopeptidase family-domain-containing protein [Syncephalis pseudoplumigaleata]